MQQPTLEDHLLLSVYGYDLLKDVVERDLIKKKFDLKNSEYFIHEFSISISGLTDTVVYKYEDLKVFKKIIENPTNQKVLYFTGDIPKTGDIFVDLIRTVGRSKNEKKFKYMIKDGKIVFDK